MKEATEEQTPPPPLLLFAALTTLLITAAMIVLALLHYADGHETFILILLLAAPLIRTVTEMIVGSLRFSIANILYGYITMLLVMILLIAVPFAALPLMFFVGPVWFFMLFTDIGGLIIVLFSETAKYEPFLCTWLDVAPGYCLPVQIGYHLFSALSLGSAMKYGDRLLDVIAVRAADIIDRMAQRMEHVD